MVPGGWIEQTESFPFFQTTLKSGNSLYDLWNTSLAKSGQDAGLPFDIDEEQLKKWLLEAGFINVKAERQQVPIGGWPETLENQEIGVHNLGRWRMALDDYSRRRLTEIG